MEINNLVTDMMMMSISHGYVTGNESIEKLIEKYKDFFVNESIMMDKTKEDKRVKMASELITIGSIMLAKKFNTHEEDFIKLIDLLQERINEYKEMFKKLD